jgi:hypothetical protein
VGKANAEKLTKEHGEGKEYEEALMQTFANVVELKNRYGKDFSRIPPSAIGMYNYYVRLTTGLQQLMAGARKFRLDLIERSDLMSLTREAAEVSGIPYLMDVDKEEVNRILN